MNALDMHFVAQMSIERLLNGLGQGTAIALFAWLMLRLIGRRNSGTRFAVWFSALLAIAMAPLVELPGAAAAMTHPASAAFTMPQAWSSYLFAGWALIAAVGMARVVVGLRHLGAIRKNCQAVNLADLDPAIGQTLAEFRSVRSVELCASEELSVPTAVGFFRPVVVIPRWALGELSSAELNAVVLHELAHLRRWDDWTNLAQKFLRALFFFHPAVWFVESRLSLEREMACDDLVLAQTANPRAYAECLVSLAEKNFLQRGVALAQAAVGRMRQTSLRVLQILDSRRSKAVGVWKPAPWVVAGFSVACLVGAEHAPRLIAFSDFTPSRVDSSIAAGFSTGAREYAPPVVPVSYTLRDRLSAASPMTSRKPVSHPKAKNVLKADIEPSVYKAPIPATSLAQTLPPANRQGRGQPDLKQTATVIPASAIESADIAVMQQTVFVMVQNDPWGNGFPVLWRVSVWKFTVVPHTAPRVIPESSSKSI